MFNEAKKAYGICKQENYPDDQTKAICRVFNTETSRALYEKQVMEKEGITIVNFSETSDVEDYRSCDGLSSIEMDPCEALLIKEQIRIKKIVRNPGPLLTAENRRVPSLCPAGVA